MEMAKWKQYLVEAIETRNNFYSYTQDTYRLAAVGGDVSAKGMSNNAVIKHINRDDFEQVDAYLNFEYRYDEFTKEYLKQLYEKNISDKESEIAKEIAQLEINLLKNLSHIFLNKYEVRSTWAWLETPEFDYESYDAWEELQEDLEETS